jgi:hypothetical protein
LTESRDDARTVEQIVAERRKRNGDLDWDLPIMIPEVFERAEQERSVPSTDD